jgi:hypothetical protein
VRPLIFILLLASCGGGPVARNIPTPNKAAAAGITAGAAAALTLADPKAAAAVAESAKVDDEKKPQKSGGTVPADVFDRLDQQQTQKTGAPGSEP